MADLLRSHPGPPLRSVAGWNGSMRRGPPAFGLLAIVSFFQIGSFELHSPVSGYR
jgi:hypothetical protein